ncbi:MAG: nuclear transport factor 2 family protein [Chloroflexota bacterium]
MSRDNEAIDQTFNEYVQAFQTLDPRSVAPYCDVPFLFIAPSGTRVMTTSDEVESLLSVMMAALKARDYARSEITDMNVTRMSESSALVSVRRIRYRTDGAELERLGETYTLRKVDHAWKLVAALVHDADAIIGLASGFGEKKGV